MDQALVDVDHIVDIDKRELHIRLCELGLSVGAQILIAEALRDLEVAVETGAHQQLLEQLGGLGQRIEIAGMHAAGDQIVSRALGRGLAQDGGLDLEEALTGHELSHVLDHLASEDQPSLHIRTAKVQTPVLEAQVFLGVAVLDDMKGRCLSLGEDPGLLDPDLDRAGRDIRVHRFSPADSACRGDDEFRSHFLCFGKIFSTAFCLFIDQLQDAASVTQIHEDKSAFVSLFGHPSHYGDGLAHVGFTQLSTSACAL